jgi:propanol-preferring alcohol dehydrogenase
VPGCKTLQFAERGLVKTHFETYKIEEITSVFERIEKGEL